MKQNKVGHRSENKRSTITMILEVSEVNSFCFETIYIISINNDLVNAAAIFTILQCLLRLSYYSNLYTVYCRFYPKQSITSLESQVLKDAFSVG
jgi:hypothetical protein